ncbi:MAG TPA: glycoside hydrolase family 3 protein [Patescibacteria group bacterium]|nr:glycoside hydrolase family 3 protein [Patescibacteria group bacterium]
MVILAGVFLVILTAVVTIRILAERGKNDEIEGALYRDETRSVEERVEDLLGRMTTEEKIGQLALVEKNSLLLKSDIARFGLGALLSGGGGGPDSPEPEAWLTMIHDFQDIAKSTRLEIPLLYGVDAVHGHSNVFGATLFPHAIGLGASGDVDLVRRIGMITAEEMAMTGANWNFSPTGDVVQDIRWGRTYETFGTDPKMVSDLTGAYVEGLQSRSVVGTAKHYLGTGAMVWGTSTNRDFQLDQGAITIDEATLRSVHLPPFARAVRAGVGSIMVGHATWNGVELVANHTLLTDVLKGELGFDGFVVSDWYGVYEIPGDKYHALVTAINAGVDMVMLPYDYRLFTQDMRRAVEQGDLSRERLDDAVRRILRVKFAAGLFEKRAVPTFDRKAFGSSEHREVAREAVRKSLVLLKNEQHALPISKTTAHIVVAGGSADNLGRQSGGWTVEWQGIDGNWIPGTTILQAIKSAVSSQTKVEYRQAGDFPLETELADVGIAVVGEAPYAEGWGDSEHPTLSDEDLEAIRRVRAISKKLIVVIVSGRPLDISSSVKNWDAVVAAWLPGSEGGGLADVLFGDHPFTGTLPVAWPLEKKD